MDYRRQRGYNIRSNLSGGYTPESIQDNPRLIGKGWMWRRVPPWLAVLTALSPIFLLGVIFSVQNSSSAVRPSSPGSGSASLTIELIAPEGFGTDDHPHLDLVIEPEAAEALGLPETKPFMYRWYPDPSGSPTMIPDRTVAVVDVRIGDADLDLLAESCLLFRIQGESQSLAHSVCRIPGDGVTRIGVSPELLAQLN